jgi:hypothetical protein
LVTSGLKPRRAHELLALIGEDPHRKPPGIAVASDDPATASPACGQARTFDFMLQNNERT